jgi:hypothetical protein
MNKLDIQAGSIKITYIIFPYLNKFRPLTNMIPTVNISIPFLKFIFNFYFAFKI